jgi:hypothetical protein
MIPIPILLQQQQRPLQVVSTEAAIAWRWGSEYLLPSTPTMASLVQRAPRAAPDWLLHNVLATGTGAKIALENGHATHERFLAWAMQNAPAIVYGLCVIYPRHVGPQLHLTPAESQVLTNAVAILQPKLAALSNNKTDYAKLYEHIRARKP